MEWSGLLLHMACTYRECGRERPTLSVCVFEVPLVDLAGINNKSACSLLHRNWFSNLSLCMQLVRYLDLISVSQNCYVKHIVILICLNLVPSEIDLFYLVLVYSLRLYFL